ncbi:MAG: adenosylcobinamide-phosphate synthase CbiB [Alphaproteobacteria bacterium]|nr:adenosylcobinamide-phosphate synthase CbiB [Alphaproteobacteria bacterium]
MFDLLPHNILLKLAETLSIDWQQRLSILAMALILDAVIGDPDFIWRRIPHPVAWVGSLIARLERRFNHGGGRDRQRFIAGICVSLSVLLAAIIFGLAVASLKFWAGWGLIAEIAFLAILLAQKSLFLHVWRVRQALKKLDELAPDEANAAPALQKTRQELAKIVGRDVARLDTYALARAAVESLAENFADGVVAPALFYLALGLPGIAFYKALNTLDSMIGHHSLRYEWFGKFAARLDDVANYIPARLAAIFFVMAAIFAPKASAPRAVATLWRDASHHRSVNAGWPEAALAGALDFALAGPRFYHGLRVDDAWMGGGRARLNWRDIDRALLLYALAGLLQFLLVLVMMLAIV